MSTTNELARQAGMDEAAYIKRLMNDLPFCVGQCWSVLHLDRYAPLGWVELDILDWLQNGPTTRGVLAPRGFGKTTFGTIGVSAWYLLRNPETRIIVVSKSHTMAKRFISGMRTWIDTIPFLQHLRPQPSRRNHRQWRDNSDSFDTGPSTPTKDPSVTALGIEGQLPGTRAHLVIADDVETHVNTKTLDAREDLQHRVNEFTSVASFGDREIVYFGTYHHEESLYLKESNKGVAFRTWPLLHPRSDEKILGLAPVVQQQLDDKTAQPGDIVADYRIDPGFVADHQKRGKRHFAMQMQLVADLGDREQYPLALRDLIVFPVQRDKAPIHLAWGTTSADGRSTRVEDIPSLGFGRDGLHSPIMFDREWADYTGTKAFLDPAGTGGDEMALAIVAMLHGFLFVKAVAGFRGGATQDNLTRIVQLLRQHGAHEMAIEKNFGGEYIAPLIQPIIRRHSVETHRQDAEGVAYPDGWACHVDLIHNSRQKEVRIIETLEPVMLQHRLVVDRDVAADEELQRQITKITYTRDFLGRDDRIDALAGAVAMWQTNLDLDPDEAAQRQRDQWIDDELDQHRRLAGQTPKGPPRWFRHDRAHRSPQNAV